MSATNNTLNELKQAFVPVALIDDTFPLSGQSARLEVLRTWPRGNDTSKAIRLELVDVNRSETNLPIICELSGSWQNIPSIDKYDVLLVTGCSVAKSSTDKEADELEHQWKLTYTDNDSNASLVVYGYRDRILARPGKNYSLATLKGQTK